MSEVQRTYRPEEASSAYTDATKVDLRLSSMEDKARLRRKKLYDKAASGIITFGGIAIILSIVAILFVIVAETLPLWSAPDAEFRHSVALAQVLDGAVPNAGKPIAFGVEEYQEIAYVVTDSGSLHFISLKDNSLLQQYTIAQLQGHRPTAVYQSAFDHMLAIGTANGLVVPVSVNFGLGYDAQGKRVITPSASEDTAIALDPQGRAIQQLVYRTGEDEEGIRIAALLGPRALVLYSQIEQESFLGEAETQENRVDLSPDVSADVTAIELDAFLTNLLVTTATGELLHWQVQDPAAPRFIHTFPVSDTPDVSATILAWILGGRSLVIGDSAGGVSVWFQVRDEGPPADSPYRKIHILEPHPAPVTTMSPSARDKGFITADTEGNILLHHATSEQTLLELNTGEKTAIQMLSFAPRVNGIFSIDAQATLSAWSLDNPHPEINFTTLFRKVWYEGYREPDYTWQSSSGTDDFEPKFSLTPLAYGTLKGTFYALLLAIPLSLCAALYTSQFMHPSLRNLIKPSVEVMAALPSVVLGFFAGLWLAPLVADMVPALFLMAVVLPSVTLGAALVWRMIPLATRSGFRPGVELVLLVPVLVGALYVCVLLSDPIEAAFFSGDFPQWLYDTTGSRYDPRNSLIVGFAMGFAVIPIIYTICEDAFSNVPQHLVSGSLALGANRWQTAVRVVVPTASPGVFSAIMIGFGRAVGETMIVLMATGNTPVMDFDPFSGFRALSANIAVEIPEAPHGGTLYRILFLAALLLFILTFVVNTAAELVRQNLRERYSRI